MNSPIKDALTDFIKSNTAAIEKAMENGEEHGEFSFASRQKETIMYISSNFYLFSNQQNSVLSLFCSLCCPNGNKLCPINSIRVDEEDKSYYMCL